MKKNMKYWILSFFIVCSSVLPLPANAGFDEDENDTVILHKSRDSKSRDVRVKKGVDKNGKVWLGMGGKKGYCMAFNSSGLAGVMNGGELCSDNSTNKNGKKTPELLEIIISTCNTAQEAVEMLRGFLKKGDYEHGDHGSIFFFADTKEGFLVENTAGFMAVQKCNSGYAIRANIWHLPGLEKYALTDYKTYAVESTREYAVRTALNEALASRKRITVQDCLDISRLTKTSHPIITRSVCCSWTNSCSSFELDREFPDVLSTAYMCVGSPRNTVVLPFPICIKTLPEELATVKVASASYARMGKLGYAAEMPQAWKACEKKSFDSYDKALVQAKALLKNGKKAEAVKLLNDTFNKIWQEAKNLPGLLK